MSQLSFWALQDAAHAKRQALTSFAASELVTVPRSMGFTECGDDGLSVGPSSTPVANSLPSVTTTSSEVLASSSTRRGVIFYNASDFRIWLTLGATAVLNTGIPLEPGEKWTFTQPRNARYTGPISAIHGDSGNKSLSVNPW
jgi:hypothetical protein